MRNNEPIDAVLTWVDGSDKKHAEKLTTYCTKHQIDRQTEAASPTRFNDRGELHYSVNSLLRFAPWLRRIYIVTDDQIPPVFTASLANKNFSEKIKLIDHREVFVGYEQCLPTFNSLSIETVLWRIKDLSNQFIYLNDDFVLIRPVSEDDFFRDGKLVLRGCWKVQMEKKWRNSWKRIIKPFVKKSTETAIKNPHRAVQEKTAQLTGFKKKFFHLPHVPHPVMKSTFEQYFLTHPEHFKRNLSFPLRDPHQYWPISLAQHLEIQRKKAIFDNSLQSLTIHGAYHSLNKIKAQLKKADKRRNIPFICLQSLDEATESTQNLLLDWLEQRINPLIQL